MANFLNISSTDGLQHIVRIDTILSVVEISDGKCSRIFHSVGEDYGTIDTDIPIDQLWKGITDPDGSATVQYTAAGDLSDDIRKKSKELTDGLERGDDISPHDFIAKAADELAEKYDLTGDDPMGPASDEDTAV